MEVLVCAESTTNYTLSTTQISCWRWSKLAIMSTRCRSKRIWPNCRVFKVCWEISLISHSHESQCQIGASLSTIRQWISRMTIRGTFQWTWPKVQKNLPMPSGRSPMHRPLTTRIDSWCLWGGKRLPRRILFLKKRTMLLWLNLCQVVARSV